jgi:hypothetical protein
MRCLVVVQEHALAVLKVCIFKFVQDKAELAVFKEHRVRKEPQYKDHKELKV